MYDEADVEGGCAVRPCTMCCRREGPHRLRTAHPSASPVPHAVCCALCRPARLPRVQKILPSCFALKDEVWRLEKVGKAGAFPKNLNGSGIYTVEDFLRFLLGIKEITKYSWYWHVR